MGVERPFGVAYFIPSPSKQCRTTHSACCLKSSIEYNLVPISKFLDRLHKVMPALIWCREEACKVFEINEFSLICTAVVLILEQASATSDISARGVSLMLLVRH